MRILSFDPGKTQDHFAYSFAENAEVIEYGSVVPLEDLTSDFNDSKNRFYTHACRLIERLQPDLIVVERYLDRGGPKKGAVGEYVSVMIGILSIAAMPVPVELVMSSTWKVWFRRHFNIGKGLPIECLADKLLLDHPHLKGKKKKDDKVTVHHGDAVAMGFWRFRKESPDFQLDAVWKRNPVKMGS